MTRDQVMEFEALGRCTFAVGSPDKRFVRDILGRLSSNPSYELTAPQIAYLERLTHRYRRQLDHGR